MLLDEYDGTMSNVTNNSLVITDVAFVYSLVDKAASFSLDDLMYNIKAELCHRPIIWIIESAVPTIELRSGTYAWHTGAMGAQLHQTFRVG